MGQTGIAKTLPSTAWSQLLLQRGYKSQSAFKTITLPGSEEQCLPLRQKATVEIKNKQTSYVRNKVRGRRQMIEGGKYLGESETHLDP